MSAMMQSRHFGHFRSSAISRHLAVELGFKIDGRLEASVHVHRDGLVAMGDLPRVAGLTQAQRVAEPNIRLRAVGAASCQMN